MCVFLCECGLEKKRVERPWSPYVWSGCSSVVQHDGTMTTLSPEHRGRERQGWWNKREKREERAKEANKREERCARVRTEADTKGKERKEKEGKEMRGQERRGKGKERGRKGLAWAAKQEVWGPSAMSASFSHFTHTHDFAPTMVMFSLSLNPPLTLFLSHTQMTTSHTLISPLSSSRIIRTKVQQQPGQTGSVSGHNLGRLQL